MSLAWPSLTSTPSLISQQSFAPGVSHIFGALSVLKMRQASRLLPSKRDFHGPGFPADWAELRTRQRTSGIMDAMPERYIMTPAKGGCMDETNKGVSRRHFIETAAITGAG